MLTVQEAYRLYITEHPDRKAVKYKDYAIDDRYYYFLPFDCVDGAVDYYKVDKVTGVVSEASIFEEHGDIDSDKQIFISDRENYWNGKDGRFDYKKNYLDREKHPEKYQWKESLWLDQMNSKLENATEEQHNHL